MKDNIGITANFSVFVHNKKGVLIQESHSKNLVVDSGRQVIANIILGGGFRPDTMQLGNGTSVTAASMTALENSLVTKTINRRISLTFGGIIKALVRYDEGNGYTYSEGGSFFQNTMIARALISPVIVKTSSVRITISHQFGITAII